jgi:hypothetical protein
MKHMCVSVTVFWHVCVQENVQSRIRLLRHNSRVDVLSVACEPLQLRACRRPHDGVVEVVLPLNLPEYIHRCLVAHVPIPQLGDSQFSCHGQLKRLHKPGVDKLLSDAGVPLGNDISPDIRTLSNLDHARNIHLVPKLHSACTDESVDVSPTPLVHKRNSHATRVGTPLGGRQVRTRAKVLVAAAVLRVVHCIVGAAETTRVLGCWKCGEEAGVGLVEVGAAERVRSPHVAGALVPGGGGGCTLVRRHDRC